MVVTSFLSLFLLGFSSAHALKGAYPKPGHVPPVDSLQVKTWLQDINLSGAPNTTTTGKRLDCKDSSASNIWACNKSASTDDITQCTVPNTWGLAFHDDSSEQTGQLARFLREHNITATFFLTGSNVAKNKEMIKEYLHGSHHLGSNTWSHTALTGLTNEQIVAEMKWTEMAVLEVTGLRLKYVRPPYGAIDDRVRFVLKAMGYVVVDWTKELDTTAWEVNGDELVTHFTASVKDYNNNATTKGFINDERTTSIAKELISNIMKWDTKGTKGHKGMAHHSKAHKATTHPSKAHKAVTHPSKEAATKIPISFTSIPGCVNETTPYQIRNATTGVPTSGPISTGLQNSPPSPDNASPGDASPSTNTASCLGEFKLAPFVAMVIASVFLA